ncbi:MAG: hypothetical protein AAF152_02470 [Cyanobacteria bacterium P01_A01_bin.114]
MLESCAASGDYSLELEALENPLESVAASEMTTTSEWLDMKGTTLTEKQKALFTRKASDLYKAKYGQKPRIISRANDQGHFNVRANGFLLSQHEGLLEEALSYAYQRTRP